jgi:phytanoyl-CoA hydroxylase
MNMLTASHTEHYCEHGYTIVRGLLDADELAAVLDRLEQAVTRQLDPNIYVQIEPGHENDPPDPANPWRNIRKAAALIRYDPFFQRFVAQDKFIAIVQSLVGDQFRCLGDEAQLKPPRVGSAHPWHQDQPYYSGLTQHFATIWLALDPATQANGCIQVIPGSHNLGEIERRNPKQSWFDDDEIDTSQAVHAELAPGDALIFHSRALHGSDRNETDVPRRSFIFRYIDVSDLPDEHWPLVHKHGVMLDDDNAPMIFRGKP